MDRDIMKQFTVIYRYKKVINEKNHFILKKNQKKLLHKNTLLTVTKKK